MSRRRSRSRDSGDVNDDRDYYRDSDKPRSGNPHGNRRGRSNERGRDAERNQEESRHHRRRGRDKTAREDSTKFAWGNSAQEEEYDEIERRKNDTSEVVKVQANFGLSGALAKDEATGNMKNGIVLKWSAPLDDAKPTKQWRFYVFKDNDIIETLHIHRQSCYLVGRDNRVCDIVLQHPSISKQHCVIQFRSIDVFKHTTDSNDLVLQQKERRSVVKPYIMDLESTHKTLLNGEPLEDARYYEIKEKDSIKFGVSTREYVLMCAD